MRKKICRWLYERGMEWLAWRISPSLTCYVIGEIETESFKKAFDERIKSVLPDECNSCDEYHDYHCEKWCTVIRQTIADMEEDWIPIYWIEEWLNKYPNMSDGSKSIVRMMMNDWQNEKEKQND